MNWFPGGAKLLVSGPAAGGVWGIWTLATVGGELQKLQDFWAIGAVVSPDGSRIAFLKQGAIWLMGPNGEEPAPLVKPPPGQDLSQLNWSPDGRWLSYVRSVPQTGAVILEARLMGAGSVTTVLEDPDLKGFCWLASGHIVLDRWEVPDHPFSNLWDIHVDPKKMKAVDKPHRLTNWAGFAIGGMSASKDGRLAIIKRLDQSDVVVGELADQGERLLHPRRLTSDERIDWPGGWCRDSKSLLFQSDRTGRMSVFRQRMESTNPETVVANQDHNRNPVFSPDGRWVIYLAWRGSAAQAKTGRLMRMPAGGGSPELILETRGLPGFVTSGHVLVPTTAGHPAFRCPTRPGASCVLSEAKDREVVFSSFDPAPSAAKAEIFRIEVNNPNNLFWDLSPDGSRIAYGERSLRSLIQVRELRQGKTRDVSMANWPELLTLGWSADGKSLFATNFEPTASLLLRITLDGKVIVLYKAAKEVEAPRASPDGRYLAFGEVISSSNVWLIERIPL